MSLKVIYTIIKSRLQKPKTDKEIERKRAICLGCEFNSNNLRKLSTYKLFLASLSDFYSWITGNKEEDNLGVCTACSSCSIFYKSQFELECPHPEGDKWKIMNTKESLLEAYRNGKTIQSNHTGRWHDFIPQNQVDSPNFDYGTLDNWRIKP